MNFITERLKLRPISIDGKEAVFRYRLDGETNKYQGWIPKNIKDVEEFIKKTATEYNQPETWFQLVIIEKKTDNIIGDIGIHFLNIDDKQVEIGYTLDRDFHGMGYATEALISVIDSLFNDLKKHRITASIDPKNTASIKLVERLGFRKEAHFVESYYSKGKWVDDVVFALLEKEWQEFRSEI